MTPLDFRWSPLRGKWPLLVKNGSGAAIPPFSIVLISSVAITNNELVHTVVQPNAASTDFNWNGYLVTGPMAIGSGSTQGGLASDLVQPNYVRYDNTGWATPARGDVGGPKHGQLTIAKGYYGFEIQGGKSTECGNTVVVAKWVGVDSFLGKVDASVTGGATVTVSVWSGTTAGSESDTTMNVASCYLKYGYVPSAGVVRVQRLNGLPYITSDHRTIVGKPDGNISKGGSGTFSIYNSGSDTGDNVTAVATGVALTGSKWCSAWQEDISGNWLAGCWES